MQLDMRSQTFGGSDQRFLVDPEDNWTVGCTIDLALIDPNTLAAWETDGNTAVPAGSALGINRGSGVCALWGTDRVNEVQVLTRTSTGGTVTLTVDGETTAAVAATAVGFTAAAAQAATDALSNTEPGDITWTGSAGGPLTATFGGKWADKNMPTITVDNGSATGGTITVATSHGGAAGAYEPAGLLFDDVRFTKGQRTGKVGAARIIMAPIYGSKLPNAGDPDGTPGKVDAAFKAEPNLQIAYAD